MNKSLKFAMLKYDFYYNFILFTLTLIILIKYILGFDFIKAKNFDCLLNEFRNLL